MKAYRALCTIKREGKRYRAGEEIVLPDASAKALLERDYPAIAVIAEPAAAPAAKEPPKDPPLVEQNAKLTIERVRASEDVVALLAIRDAELARGVVRRTVLDAIDERLTELEQDETDAGEGDAE